MTMTLTTPNIPTRSVIKPTPAPLRSWLPAYLAIAAIWGTSFMFIKIAVAEVPPVYLALGRIGLGALTLLTLTLLLRQWLPRDRRLWAHLFVMAVFANSIPFMLFAYAEQRVSSVLAGIWNGTVPLTTLIVTLVALPSERPTRQRIVGLLLGFVGVLVVLGIWDGVGASSFTGQLMLFGAVVCYGIAFNHVRWIMKRWDTTPLALSTGQLSLSTLQMLVVAPLVAGAPPALGSLSGRAILSIVMLGVFASGLAFLFNFQIVKVAGVTTASTVTYLSPVIGAAAGVLVLHEHLHWNQPIGGLIALFGVAVSQGRFNRRAPLPNDVVRHVRRSRRAGPRRAGY